MTAPEEEHAARLGVGVVGLGMAAGVMVPVIAAHPRLRLAAAAEPHAHLRDRFVADFDLPATADLAALLARDDVDVVYIATPQQFHAEHALAALAAGKHVVLEKPMALSLAECDAMVAAADAAQRVLIVGHTHGFDPGVAAIRALVTRPEVGRAVFVNSFNYTSFMYRPRRPEELDPARGGGVLWNQIPHQIDVIRSIVDAPLVSVRAMAASLDPARRVDGLCGAFLTFAGGAAATLTYSGYDRFDSDEWSGWVGAAGQPKTPAHGAAWRSLPSGADAEIAARRTEWSYGGAMMPASRPGNHPHVGQLIVSCERGDLRQSPDGVVVYDRDGARTVAVPLAAARPGHVAVWDELLAAVRSGRPATHDARFGRDTVAACLAIAASIESGREVRLDDASGEITA